MSENAVSADTPREASREVRPVDPSTLVVAGCSAALLIALSGYLISRGYLTGEALRNWAKVSATAGASETRLEYLGLLYPHLPLYLLFPFQLVPLLRSPAAPYFVSALVAALFLGYLDYRLRKERWSPGRRALVLGATLAHPALLWSGTRGGNEAISLFLFFMVGLAVFRLRRVGDARAHILLGGLLATFFLVDVRSVYVGVAALPLLPLIAKRDMLDRSSASVFLMVFLPLGFGLLTWTYLNWLFLGDPLSFLHQPASAFLGDRQLAPQLGWLRAQGGSFLAPLVVAGGATLLAFAPASAVAVRSGTGGGFRSCVAFLLGVLVLATALGTETSFLGHPRKMLFLGLAAQAAVLASLPRGGRRSTGRLAGLLVAGTLASWALFLARPDGEARRWMAALEGGEPAEAYRAEVALGRWSRGKQDFMMDDELGFPAVAVRDDPAGLILPFSDRFQLLLARRELDAGYVAVPDPERAGAHRDRLNQTFPGLYADGHPGYRMVYDSLGWRVYRKRGADRKETVTTRPGGPERGARGKS